MSNSSACPSCYGTGYLYGASIEFGPEAIPCPNCDTTGIQSIKRLVPKCPAGCAAVGTHIHDEQWDAYWTDLTEAERRFLRDKASREHMSLSAIAIEWEITDGAAP